MVFASNKSRFEKCSAVVSTAVLRASRSQDPLRPTNVFDRKNGGKMPLRQQRDGGATLFRQPQFLSAD